MKILNGAELAGFIKERQAHQVSMILQTKKIVPKLAIILCGDNPASVKYVSLKDKYSSDIGVKTEIYNIDQSSAIELIEKLNNDDNVHGIIVQLPLPNITQTEDIVSHIASHKDVDSLTDNSDIDSATATAILWLLAGYNINMLGKNVVIVGQGKLVGEPLRKMLEASGIYPKVITIATENTDEILSEADVIITAVGKPGILHEKNIPLGAVVVDAGVASEDGMLKGDVADSVYKNRDDLTITPTIGGVGPLTICALFDNVIRACQK